MGRLICVKLFNNLPDLCPILYTFNEAKSQFDDGKPIPDGAVKNLATCISFDEDFILIGDAYKNIAILKKLNAAEQHS
jgi:hypothetical protein